jgi:hypothetical protein
MSLSNDDIIWLKRGRQRSAVARVLRKPLTTSEICRIARHHNLHIQLRDVWHVMNELREHGLATCLNPRYVTGKLYALTGRGKIAVEKAFGIKVEPLVQSVDWGIYAQVVRAKIRKVVLLELAQMPDGVAKTASNLRKRLRSKYPIGLNPTIRALKELTKLGLVQPCPAFAGGGRRSYAVTARGRSIIKAISQ